MKITALISLLITPLFISTFGYAGPLVSGGTTSRVAQCMSLTGSAWFELIYTARTDAQYVGILNGRTVLSCKLTAPYTYRCVGETVVNVGLNSKGQLVAQEQGRVVEMPCPDNERKPSL